jgi:putative tryptophan/tyrosine transport system substrate-binding protein
MSSTHDVPAGGRAHSHRRGIAAALALVLALVAATGCGSSSGGSGGSGSTSTTAKSVSIGVIEQAEVPVFDEMVAGYREGFAAAAGLPLASVKVDIKNAQGDASLIETIARQLARGSYDQFVAIGSPAVIALGKQEKRRPIVTIAMTDPVGAKVAQSLERPGGNVTGTSDQVPPESVVRYLAQLTPRPKRIGTVLDPSNPASAFFLKGIRPLLAQQGMQLVEAPISGAADIAAAARSLGGRVDAIALPGDAVATGAGLPAITAQALAHKLPLVIAAGIDAKTLGILATLSPDDRELGRIAGTEAGRIFRGKGQPASTPFARIQPQVAVNPKTEKAIGRTAPTTLG